MGIMKTTTTTAKSNIQFDSYFAIGNLTLETVKKDPVPIEILHRFHMGMTGVWYVICLTGVCTNAFNLRTFAVMGLSDSVTVSFFCLAISDFSICTIAFVEMFPFLLDVLQREYDLFFYLPPMIPAIYMACLRRAFNCTTILITTFLAVQRCLCVVMPFHVKGMFTRFRTVVFMVVILAFAGVCSGLYMWTYKVVPGTNRGRNSNETSQVQVYVPAGSEPYHFLMEVFVGLGLNFACQALVVICLVVMAVALRKSTQFRQSATSTSTTTAHVTRVSREEKKTDAETTAVAAQAQSGALQGKEKTKESQALVQVSLVSTIFVITNTPYLGFGIANSLIPEFGSYRAYNNLFQLVLNLMFTAELLNSSMNFVVYYKYNTKFRKCLPFGCGKR